MPEAIVAPEPASGMADLIKNQFSAPSPAAPQVAPAAQAATPPEPAKVDAPKPPEASTPPKQDDAKPTSDDIEVETARKANPGHKAWKILDSIKAKYSTNEAALKAEIARIQAKPVEGVADAGKVKALEDRLAEVLAESKTKDQRVAEADYTRSSEYQTKYLQPYKQEQQRALDEIGRMNFSYTEDGETKTRPATESDLKKAMALSGSEQDEFITKSFGNSAWRLIARINKLEEIRSESIRATEEHGKNFEKVQAERETLTKKEREDYDKGVAAAHSELQKDTELGKYVSESETDPEGTQLLKTELERFDAYRNSHVTPKDSALVRARFAMTPRLLHDNKKLSTENASLKAELAKMRGADPGAPTKVAVGAAPVDADAKGVKGLVEGMKW